MDTKTLLIAGAVLAIAYFAFKGGGSEESGPQQQTGPIPGNETDGRRTAREVIDTLGQIGIVAAEQYRRWRDATRAPEPPRT